MKKCNVAVAVISVLMLLSGMCVTGCNTIAKKFGGTITEKLPKGQKLENITWKENQLWIVMRPMRSEEVAETHTFQESSVYGIVEGKVIVVESK